MSIFLGRYSSWTNCWIFLITACMCFGEFYDSISKKIYKCCPDGFELSISVDNDVKSHKFYDCMPQNENVTKFWKDHFFGFQYDNDDHFPTCDVENLIDFEVGEEGRYVSSTTCVDLVQNEFHIVTCQDEMKRDADVDENDVMIHITNLRKCCPEFMDYDIINSDCIGKSTNYSSLETLLANSIPLYTLGAPKCKKDEVLVEYHSHLHEISFTGNTLRLYDHIDSSYVTIRPSLFCADSANHPMETTTLMTLTSVHSLSSKWMARACRPKLVCDFIPCIRKCCRSDTKMEKKNGQTVCTPHYAGLRPIFHDLDGVHFPVTAPPTVEPTEFGVFHGQDCDKYLVSPDDYDVDIFYVNAENGHLHFDKILPFSHENYCMDFLQMGEEVQLRTFVCFDEVDERDFKIYAIGLIVSCLFLALTLLVYACLPKLMNLHGKTLVCHVTSLMIAYAGLSYVQMGTEFQPRFCNQVALLIYFTFLAAFSWMNVMCFDIWWTFGTVRTSRGMRKTRDTRRFILYSLYAWGIPMCLTIFTYCVDRFKWFNKNHRPNMGKYACWFEQMNSNGHRLFFLLPIGIQFIFNFILFVLTAIHCNKVKSEIYKMQNNDEDGKKKRFFADKARLVMNLKLFIVMGVTWLLELLATIFNDTKEVWYLADTFNVLQGLFIFMIFVFKRNVLHAIQKRLGIPMKTTRGGQTATTAATITSGATSNQVCIDPYSTRYGKLGKCLSNATIITSHGTSAKKSPQ